MADDSFILMSLKEDKIKKMTQVLNNNTCRSIIDFLSKNESATATDISKKLNLAMSTVHYNLKQLSENGLVSAEEYHYSQKGKEVIHYRLANKYIIIAPKDESSSSILSKLKSFIPISLIAAGASALVFALEFYWDRLAGLFAQKQMLVESDSFATRAVMEIADYSAEALPVAAEPTAGMIVAPWFFAGAMFSILVFIAYDLSKKNKK